MAGDWIKMEVALPDKPEVWRMAGVLSIDADSVVGKLLRVWAWFDSHTEDGNAVGVSYPLLDRVAGVAGFAEAMALVGWLEQNGHVLTLPKFGRHNGKTAKNRALTNERVAKSRTKQRDGNDESNAGTVTESVTKTVTREEKRREEKDSPPTPSEPSAIGAVGKALKGAGIDPQTINLADPILRSLVEQGATPEEFAGLAREAISGGKRNPIAWVLAVLPQRRSDAANVRLAAAPVVKSESSEDYVKRMAEEREAERKRLEGSTGPPPDLRDKVKAMVKGMRV